MTLCVVGIDVFAHGHPIGVLCVNLEKLKTKFIVRFFFLINRISKIEEGVDMADKPQVQCTFKY